MKKGSTLLVIREMQSKTTEIPFPPMRIRIKKRIWRNWNPLMMLVGM